jgi:hypothetical protein
MATKNSNYLYVGSKSDIHLLHPRNPTYLIVKNLIDSLSDPDARKLDLLLICGDVFDSLGNLNTMELTYIMQYINFLFAWARENNVIVRVLEGTPSHDREQSRMFEAVRENDGYQDVDFKYVTTLSIEYIESIKKNILYIPDEWRTSTEETLAEVKDLLKAKGLTKFDIGCFHGQFDYQLPPHVHAPKHDSEAYMALCNDAIFIGHVHIHSRKKKILAQGSFDRLSHGEEGAKGHLRVKINPNHGLDVKFVENKNAMRFDTIKCVGMELTDAIQKVTAYADKFDKVCWLRIEAEKGHLIFDHLTNLADTYRHIKWSKLVRDLEEEADEQRRQEFDDDDVVRAPTAITITPNNIYDQLIKRVGGKCENLDVLAVAMEQLQEVM